ncbi:MAG: tetratricopeptide repeat protein [Oscillospiraceae bacterium]|jgi:hypothetical protein|nr:tetratricopeptide repeat protein [Oscillospiraceae bacterium]
MKKPVVILLALTLIFIAVSCGKKSVKPQTADDYLKLGDKYLADLDYEQAIVYYDKAIELEPKNAKGYLGLADAYEGLGERENAVRALNDGLENASSTRRLEDKLAEIDGGTGGGAPKSSAAPPDSSAETPQGSAAETERLLNEYLSSVAAGGGGESAVSDALNSEELRSLASAYFGNDPNGSIITLNGDGTGAGIYYARGNAVYVGDYAGTAGNPVRSGTGTLYSTFADTAGNTAGTLTIEGSWANDRPHGYCVFTMTSTADTRRITLSGNLTNGLYDGVFELKTSEPPYSGATAYRVEYVKGIAKVLGQDGEYNVVGYQQNDDGSYNYANVWYAPAYTASETFGAWWIARYGW